MLRARDPTKRRSESLQKTRHKPADNSGGRAACAVIARACLQYSRATLPIMRPISSSRENARRGLIVWLVLTLLLAQGLRLCLHEYDNASRSLRSASLSTHFESPLTAHMHTDVANELAMPFVIGMDDGTMVLPFVAIIVLSLVLAGAPTRFSFVPATNVRHRSRYRYFSPPGRAPPR